MSGNGNGVYFEASGSISGTPVISGNTNQNLRLNNGNPINVSDLSGANIGVTMSSGAGIVTSGFNSGDLAQFTSDEGYIVMLENGEAKIAFYDATLLPGEGPGEPVTLVEAGGPFTLPTTVEGFTAPQEGMVIGSWTVDGGETSYRSGSVYTMKAHTTFTAAEWVFEVTAHFAAGEASGEVPADMVVLPGTEITLPAYPGAGPVGYEFVGWSDGENTYAPGASYTLNADTTFTAQWTYGFSFENSLLPSGWKTDGYEWVSTTGDYYSSTGAHTGDKNLLARKSGYGGNAWLYMPVMDLSACTAATIDFWYLNRNWGGDTDEFGVSYRVDNGAEQQLFYTKDSHESWTHETLELPEAALAANVQIVFIAASNYGYGVALDDVTLNTTEPFASVTVNGVTTSYATFDEAVAAAKAAPGSTLTLLQDVALTETVELTGDLTIDLNGQSINALE